PDVTVVPTRTCPPYCAHSKLNAFPTRRSSDLEGEGEETNVSYYQTPEMDFDLGGKTIKVVSWWDMEMQPDNPDNIKKIENLEALDRKSTRLNSSHVSISYAVFCLKKKTQTERY